MNPRVTEILAHLQRLEEELEAEIAKARGRQGFSLKGRRIEFNPQARRLHKDWRIGLIAFFRGMKPFNLLTAPLIYSMIIPLALFDAWVSLFQSVYFRSYRIPRVPRSEYIAFDHRHLRYLNRIEILNCLYCSYANGVVAYAREIGSRTEQYWCPIKHALRIRDPHQRYFRFAEYGDAQAYRSRLAEFRRELQDR